MRLAASNNGREAIRPVKPAAREATHPRALPTRTSRRNPSLNEPDQAPGDTLTQHDPLIIKEP